MECIREDDEGNPITIKDKIIFAYRNQPLQKFIGVRLVSESSEYDKYIQDFNKIVNTLRFDGDEIRYSQLPNNITEKVMIDNQERVVSIRTNSEINNFRFDKNDKSITFDATGKNDTVGLTEIYLSDVLEGPYTVMIDGEPTRVLNITEGDREGIKILYKHSIHTIKIIGSEVIPEFPVAILPILAIVTGMIIIMSKKIGINNIN